MARPVSKRSVTGRAAVPKPAPKPMPKIVPTIPDLVVYDDIEQGTPEWWECRLGKATASEFATIMSDSDEKLTRSKLLNQLAAEVLTGEPRLSFRNQYTDRGNAMEGEVRDWYMATRFVDVQQVGFIWNPQVNAGWSPDGLVGNDGAIEIKTVEPHILISILKKGVFPTAHRAQCFGGAFMVGRRQWLDLIIYSHAKLPKFVARITPNDVYQNSIRDAVEVFNYDLKKLIEDLRKLEI